MLPNIAEFYPPNPKNVPPQLTKPSTRYRLQAILVIASLFLFVLIYLGLIVGFAGLSYWAFGEIAHVKDNYREHGAAAETLMLMVFVLTVISAGLLALYLIKGLFKFPRCDDHHAIEITEADQPRLFAFIRQICADTGAQAPAKIVLSPEVNAGVFYLCTFWSLFLPVRKNLHIGLGLVNCLNLSEFKAVMAHEFGHFSQRSMRLGTYVYTANRIIAEIIFGRDWLDDTLKVFDPLLKVIRWVLGGMFKVINFAHSSLQRQMEFQADLVAVSVSGSDAVVHGLVRTDFGQLCLDQTGQDLTAAGDHNLFTGDLFVHQTKAAEYLRLLKNEPKLGLPPELPANAEERVQVFPPNETVLPPMWASHPPHHERENNAKRVYIRSPLDDRPVWVLFDNPDALRQRLTQRYYEVARPDQPSEPRSTENVTRFIDNERAETIYSARYHGMYEEGLISPGDIDSLMRSAPSRYEQPKRLLGEHTAIFSPELPQRLAAYRQRRKDQERLVRFANKIELPKGGAFQFRGNSYRCADAAKLLEPLEQEIKADLEHLAALDRRIFLVYMGMAAQLGPKIAEELEYRYRFHLTVQEMFSNLMYCDREVQQALAAVTSQRDAGPDAYQAVAFALRQAQDVLGEHITVANTLRLPAFKNMRAGDPLAHFLDAKPVIHDLFGSEQIGDGTWVNQILGRHAEIIDKLRRLLFKSLGGLLCFQERIGDDWKAKYAGDASSPPTVRAALSPR